MVQPDFRPFNFIVDGATRFTVTSGNKSMIDFSGSAMTTGYNFIKPEWLLPVVSKLVFQNRYTSELSNLLTSSTDFSSVAFSTSGTEACDAALSRFGKPIFALEGAYHGLSYITRLVSNGSGIDSKNSIVHLKCPNSVTTFDEAVEYNTKILEGFKKNSKAGSIIIELVQSDGGINVIPPEFIKYIEDIAHDWKLALIVDEVYTGYGRSGEMFLYKKYGISPDMVCLGKGMAAGLPLGAVLYNGSWDLPYNQVISMQAGNMFVSRIGIEVYRALDENRLDFVRKNGKSIISRLSGIENKKISAVRGIGFMIGVEFRNELGEPDTTYAYRIREKLASSGVVCSLTGEFNNVLKISPPVLIDKETLDAGIEIIESTLMSEKE